MSYDQDRNFFNAPTPGMSLGERQRQPYTEPPADAPTMVQAITFILLDAHLLVNANET